MSRSNHLYALPPQKLSPCAAVVRDELRRVVRGMVEDGLWQVVRLPTETPEAALAAA